MLFMWMPDETAWLTVRNVLTVDGQPVPDSQNLLNEALGSASVDRRTRLRLLRDASARFSLGTIYRNINDPTLALQYLDPAMQSRFTFTLVGRERINGVETTAIALTSAADRLSSRRTAPTGSHVAGCGWPRPTVRWCKRGWSCGYRNVKPP